MHNVVREATGYEVRSAQRTFLGGTIATAAFCDMDTGGDLSLSPLIDLRRAWGARILVSMVSFVYKKKGRDHGRH